MGGEEDGNEGEYFETEGGKKEYQGADGRVYYIKSDGKYHQFDMHEEENLYANLERQKMEKNQEPPPPLEPAEFRRPLLGQVAMENVGG